MGTLALLRAKKTSNDLPRALDAPPSTPLLEAPLGHKVGAELLEEFTLRGKRHLATSHKSARYKFGALHSPSGHGKSDKTATAKQKP